MRANKRFAWGAAEAAFGTVKSARPDQFSFEFQVSSFQFIIR